jgi:hypothetical protein
VGRPHEKTAEYPGVDWKIILKWTFKKWDGRMSWSYLAQDRDRWLALVNAAMNLKGSIKCGEFVD